MTQEVLTRGPAVSPADVDRTAGGDPAWLRDARSEAWRAYEAMDLPDPGDEEWRRTDVRALALEAFGVRAPGDVRWTLPYDPRDRIAARGAAGHIAHIDGAVAFRGHGDDVAPNGIIFTDLQTAAREHGDLVRKHFGTAIKPDEWKYLALNAALWSGGCFLYVPPDTEVVAPFELTQALTSDGLAVFPRTLIVAGRNARLTFVDETASHGDGAAFVSGAVELVVGDGARVEYYAVNGWGHDVYNFNTVRAVLGRDAQFTALVAGVGSKLTKMRVDTLMPQPGARAELLGVTFGNGDQHFDYNTLQDHTGDHTISDLLFKSALTDSASLVWYGITRINPTAAGSEANQTSRNLLLSEHAKAAPIPILEIQAYDVSKCSHGATAGPVDENELFYLQSRGIARDTAVQMLVEGFFADVIDRVPDERVRASVMQAVLDKIGGEGGAMLRDEVLTAV